MFANEIMRGYVTGYRCVRASAPRSVALIFLKVSDLGSETLKMANLGSKKALKVTHKYLKVTIYWFKTTKYSVLNCFYSILAYFSAIIFTYRYSLP